MGEKGIGSAIVERREFHWVNFMETSPWSENLRKIIHIPARNLDKFIFVYEFIKYLVWRYPVFWKKACGLLCCYFKVEVLYSSVGSTQVNGPMQLGKCLLPCLPPLHPNFFLSTLLSLSPLSQDIKEREGFMGNGPNLVYSATVLLIPEEEMDASLFRKQPI